MGRHTRSQRKLQRIKAARARERGLPEGRWEPPREVSKAPRTSSNLRGGPGSGGVQAAGWPVWAKVLLAAAALVALVAVLSTFRQAP